MTEEIDDVHHCDRGPDDCYTETEYEQSDVDGHHRGAHVVSTKPQMKCCWQDVCDNAHAECYK